MQKRKLDLTRGCDCKANQLEKNDIHSGEISTCNHQDSYVVYVSSKALGQIAEIPLRGIIAIQCNNCIHFKTGTQSPSPNRRSRIRVLKRLNQYLKSPPSRLQLMDDVVIPQDLKVSRMAFTHSIGHFRVPKSLTFKARLSAKPLI